MMFNKRIFFSALSFMLSFGLLVTMFGIVPVQADKMAVEPIYSQNDFLNSDGTLKLDGSYSGSINLQNWDVRLDPEHGPVFTHAQSQTQGEWSALGSGILGNGSLTQEVWAIAVSESDVYVGGFFSYVSNNGVPVPGANYIAKWDGTDWSALGSNGAGNGSLNNFVTSIVVIGSDVYVGGAFTNVNNNGTVLNAADYIAKWDGTNWSALGSNGNDNGALNGHVTAIALSEGDLYITGSFTNVNNNGAILTSADYIAKWSGTDWSALGSNGAGDGSLNWVPWALAASGNNIYVGGEFTNVNNNGTVLNAADYIAKWDGTNWSALGSDGSGNGSLSNSVNPSVRAIAINGNNVYVGGTFLDVNNKGIILNAADWIAKWDGTNWSALGSAYDGDGVLDGSVLAIAISGNDVYAGGYFIDALNNNEVLDAADYIAKWDGTNWSALGSNGAGDGSLNESVLALTVDQTGLYVGGKFTDANNNGTIMDNADYIAAYKLGPTIFHVKSNAGGANNGTSWANAFTDLQSALAAASSGDEIWVAAGTYKPTTGTDRTISFTLKNGVAVYGGFAGTETSRTQRNYETNITTLSGNIGNIDNASDNSYHVVFSTGTNNTAILDGFTITSGTANGGSSVEIYDCGGGIYNYQSSPVLTNLIFTDHTAARAGGGIYNEDGSNPLLINVTFFHNYAGVGGGMANLGSSPTLTDVTFDRNTAHLQGGGMRNAESNPMLNKVTFTNNSTEAQDSLGGGMVNAFDSNPVLIDVMFSYNWAEGAGGGMNNSSSSPTLTNVTFSENYTKGEGGGIRNVEGSSPVLTNVTFSENTADAAGAGIFNWSSNPLLKNVTFSGNEAGYIGGGIENVSSNPVLINVILWGDKASSDLEIYNSSSSPTVTYSVVQGGYAGTGNLNVDPKLDVLADNGGFTKTIALLPGSPAINAGEDMSCPETDQRGVDRPQGEACDIGAYEYQADNIAPSLLSFKRQNPTASSTNADVLVFRATFSEAVNHADSNDFVATGTTATVTNVATIDVSTYDITVSGGDLATLNGTVGLDLKSTQDIANLAATPLPNSEPSTDETYVVDNTAPNVVSIVRANVNPTSLSLINFIVTFTKPVTGVDVSDFALNTVGIAGTSISGVSGSGAVYTVTVNAGSGTGFIRLDLVDDDSIQDVANNPLGGSGAGNGNYSSGEKYTKLNGGDTTGVFRPMNGLLYLKNKNETGFAELELNYGIPGDYPVVGDWDGDGKVTIGVYRQGKFYLRNSNSVGFADAVFAFGQVGDQPVAGDWDGDGIDTIGIYRPSNGQFLLRNSNDAGPADASFYLGNVGDVGIAGDWNGDGIDTVGVFRPINGIIFLKNTNETGFAEIALNYGIPGDKPVTGDWNSDGIDTIGVYRNGQFMLRDSNTVGFADYVFGLGNPGDMPIAGNWDGIP